MVIVDSRHDLLLARRTDGRLREPGPDRGLENHHLGLLVRDRSRTGVGRRVVLGGYASGRVLSENWVGVDYWGWRIDYWGWRVVPCVSWRLPAIALVLPFFHLYNFDNISTGINPTLRAIETLITAVDVARPIAE